MGPVINTVLDRPGSVLVPPDQVLIDAGADWTGRQSATAGCSIVLPMIPKHGVKLVLRWRLSFRPYCLSAGVLLKQSERASRRWLILLQERGFGTTDGDFESEIDHFVMAITSAEGRVWHEIA